MWSGEGGIKVWGFVCVCVCIKIWGPPWRSQPPAELLNPACGYPWPSQSIEYSATGLFYSLCCTLFLCKNTILWPLLDHGLALLVSRVLCYCPSNFGFSGMNTRLSGWVLAMVHPCILVHFGASVHSTLPVFNFCYILSLFPHQLRYVSISYHKWSNLAIQLICPMNNIF